MNNDDDDWVIQPEEVGSRTEAIISIITSIIILYMMMHPTSIICERDE